jgi:hypothetical protein
MKSIKQQYIDLQEGNMTQANFMRNLRMTLPQYITNVTSFNDSIKILKNKGILNEVIKPSELAIGIKIEMEHTDDMEVAKKIAMDHLAENPNYYSDLKSSGIDTPQGLKSTISSGDGNLNKANPRDGFSLGFFEEGEEEQLNEAKDEKTKWTNTSGKIMYDQFKEIDNLNAQEVLIGLDWEMEKNHKLTKKEAAKIVIKNLKKNPLYYTIADLAGKEGAEAEYLGGKSAQPEAHQMQFVKGDNFVDKKRGMQPVKGIEKPKKDADAKKETVKIEKGVELMSLIAKTVRGLKKMDATGEKMKKITMNEVSMNDFPGETPGRIAQQIATHIDENPILQQYSDKIVLQSNPDGFLKFGYWDKLPDDAFEALKLKFNIKKDTDYDEDTGTLIFYRLTPTTNVPGTVFNRNANITKGLNKLTKESLMQMIREELEEALGAYNSGDNVTDVTGENK